MSKRILIVGGVFDDGEGRPSGWLQKFSEEIGKLSEPCNVVTYNGGNFILLNWVLLSVHNYDIVFWLVDVDNEKQKIRDVKSINPKCLLVTSKRNDNGKYEFKELINRALHQKANLCIEFEKGNKVYGRLFDPLGAMWCEFTSDINKLAVATMARLNVLSKITREESTQVEGEVPITIDPKFLDTVRGYADTFHNIILPAEEVTRFLGNCSFRCMNGFPSFRYGDYICVSRRNIDKRGIDEKGFVVTFLGDKGTCYFGGNKPSVDTPIQLRLYEYFKNINFMIHSHVYIKDAPFTFNAIPCGGLEEVREIKNALNHNANIDFACVNLVGHGSIIMANRVEQLENIPYVGRETPERMG